VFLTLASSPWQVRRALSDVTVSPPPGDHVRPGGRDVAGHSDLQQLLLLVARHRVDLRDHLVRELLEVLLDALEVVA
jgi:hypothetical protein